MPKLGIVLQVYRSERRLGLQASVLLRNDDGKFGLSAFELRLDLAALANVKGVPQFGALS